MSDLKQELLETPRLAPQLDIPIELRKKISLRAQSFAHRPTVHNRDDLVTLVECLEVYDTYQVGEEKRFADVVKKIVKDVSDGEKESGSKESLMDKIRRKNGKR